MAIAVLAVLWSARTSVVRATVIPPHGSSALQNVPATADGEEDADRSFFPAERDLADCLELVDMQWAVLGRQALLLEFKK
jgi:hypothetical protein